MIVTMVGVAFSTVAQTMTFQNSYNLSEGLALSNSLDVSGQVDFPGDVLFSPDGTKMYVTDVSEDEVLQYTLSNPFDVSVGVTYNGALDVSGQEGTPLGVAISATGNKLFVTGINSDDVHQYNLPTLFDITTGVTLDGSVSVPSNPHDVTFNPSGDKMYVESNSFQRITQYDLNSAFDITSGITDEGNLDHSAQVGLFHSFEFSADGDRLIGQIGSGSRTLQFQYRLSNPFDLTSGVTFEGKFFLALVTNGMTFNNDGSYMYMSRGSNIEQFELNAGAFREEPVANDGSTQSTAGMQISGDMFTNAGGTLTHGVNYTIDNLPGGFTPVLDVSSNGLYATLSLNGNTSSNADVNDLPSLQFTFANSAFVGNNASAVANAVGASSGIKIDYIDNNPTLSYGLNYNLAGSPSSSGSLSVSDEQPQTTGVVFSDDGMRMFISGQSGNDGIDQYQLSSAYDISTALHQGFLNTATENNIVEGLAFSTNGEKMFVLGRNGAEVNQYDLTSAFDITSTVNHEGAFPLTSELNSPYDMSFSTDGHKMFIVDNNSKAVYQYSLGTAFEVTMGVTYDGSPFGIGGEFTSTPKGIAFNSSGSRMMITAGSSIYQYRLFSPFNVTTAAEFEGISFSVGLSSDGITFNDDGSQMFVTTGPLVFQYDFATGGFRETINNLGEVEGSLELDLTDDTFINPGGTLTNGNDYSIAGLPSGLTPIITVDNDGKGAMLTFSGTAGSHQNVNDVTSLQFTFQDDAFISGDAPGVANAIAHSVEVEIDFRDNNPTLIHGNRFNVNGLGAEEVSFSTANEESSTGGMTFNDDGMKVFIVGQSNDIVVQYSLTEAYDLSDVSVDGTLSIAAQETIPHAIEFSNDGMTMFIMGVAGKDVNQYSLSSPFDITSTVNFQGLYPVSNQENAPFGLRFSNDGFKMFVVGAGITGGSDFVHQYSLTNAFDVTSGVLYDGSPLDISGEVEVASGIAFDASGSRIFLSNDNTDQVHQYRLAVPFDVTQGAVYEGVSFNIPGFSRDVIFNQDGSKMFYLRGPDIIQYNLNLGGFTETEDNVGEVNGSIPIQIVDDLFVNEGTSLNLSTHYTISNLPLGFTPAMAVNAEGNIATLTLSGKADVHQDVHDLASLIVDFQNAAFVNSASSAVANADNHSTGLGIDYEDNNPKIIYGSDFDFENASLALQTSFNIPSFHAAEGFAFSDDGRKMFAILSASSDRVHTYQLAEPYNVSKGFSLAQTFFIGGVDNQPTGIQFSADGMRMFVVGWQNDEVNQLALNAAFDLSQGFSSEGTLDVSTEDGTPEDLYFSSDGKRLFVVGRFFNQVYQYSLTNAYDVTDGVDYDGSFDVSSQATFVEGLWFDPTGTRMFVNNSSTVVRYNLETPFEITSGVTFDNQTLAVIGARCVAISEGGEYLYTGGSQGLRQYDLGKSGFMETEANIGEVEGELVILLQDETFANAGTTLTETTHYSIAGLPTGLTPNMAVEPDGLSATLTFTSSADNHQDVHDVSNLIFTFTNSAFTQFGNASLVENSTGADPNIGIDFRDNNPTVAYGFAFDFSNGTVGNAELRVITEDNEPRGLTFSPDGTKLFIVGIQAEVNQYSLTTPFEISAGVSHDGFFDISGQETNPTGIAFNTAGTRMFIVGSNSNTVYQYAMNTAFDITDGATLNSAFSLGTFDNVVEDIEFNPDGSRMYIVGAGARDITQFMLNTPFDISDVVTEEGVPFSTAGEELTPRGIAFSADGFSMSIIGNSTRKPQRYRLTKPFDLTAGVVFDAEFDVFANSPGGIAFSANGDRMYTLDGSSVDRVRQFNLNVGGFKETAANTGNVEGSLQIIVFDEQFSNEGGTLTETTDYNITGLPAGLTPNLAVAADGLSATLTLSGSVANHQLINSVDDLQFTFQNSAFEITGDAASVANAISASSHVGIDFDNNSPVITYGSSFDLANGVDFVRTFSVADEITFPRGLAFSQDGMKMFVGGGGMIYQYTLGAPFDLTTGTLDGSFDEPPAFGSRGITFSSDGMKMYLVRTTNSFSHENVDQYSLTSPFTVTSGVSLDGKANLLGSSIEGVTFNLDGTKMYVIDRIGGDIYQYSLKSPFDILFGINLETVYDAAAQDQDPRGVAFSADGTKMFVVGGFSNEINEYALTVPYDLTGGVAVNGGPMTIAGSIDNLPESIVFSTSGHRMFILGDAANGVYQYDLDLDGFMEAVSNNGTIEGSVVIGISDDTFANPGGSLSSSTDYSVTNLPSGLVPDLLVSGDGLSATLTFTGTSDNHQNSNDISGLVFDFNNSAFINSDAVDVRGAVNTQSNIGIDFIASAETDIVSFVLAEQSSTATIDDGANTVTIDVMIGTDLSDLTPTIMVSDGATISPLSDVARDFSTDVTYTVTAENGTTTEDWTISVSEVQVAPTDIELMGSSVDENVPVGTLVGTLSTSDANVADTHTYTFVGGHPANDFFDIINGNQLVTDALAFNHEGAESFMIEIRTDDGNGGTFDEEFEIDINDINEAPTGISLDVSNSDEGVVANAFMTDIIVDDPDDGDSHTFTLVAGSGDDDNGVFDIMGVPSQLINLEDFDFESQDEYSVLVRATDTEGLFFELPLTISINDLNEAPIIEDQTFEVSEFAVNDFVIGNIAAIDPDVAQSQTLTFIEFMADPDNPLQVLADGTISVRDQSLLNHEFEGAQVVLFFDVTVTDNGTGMLSSMATITVNVLNENEAPTGIEFSDNTIDESTPIGTLIGSFETDDQDFNETHTYTLVAGSGDTGNASFDIVDDELRSAVIFDFETQQTFDIRVRSTDADGLFIEETFPVSINDLPPQITAIELDNTAVNENEGVGTLVGTFSTIGEDLADSFMYSFVSGEGDSNNSSFSTSGGQLFTTQTFDFETQNSFSIRVMTDDGELTFEQMLEITVTNVNETPVVATELNNLVRGNGFGSAEIDLSTTFTDPDGNELTFSVTSEAESVVTVSVSGAILTITEVGAGTSTITITADDGNGSSVSTDFVITVNEEQNNAPMIVNEIDDQVQDEGFGSTTIDLTNVFSDADNDVLTLTATSSASNVVTVAISGTTLTITEVGPGSAVISVTADDGKGVTVTDQFNITVEELITGIDDEIEIQIGIYPNPASDYVNIDTPEGVWSVQILSSSGQVVTMMERLDSTQQIDVQGWTRGVYFLRIFSETDSVTSKIIIE